MAEQPGKRQLRAVDAPFVVLGPSGVAVRDRLKHLTPGDEKVLRLVGEHLGRLASLDLKARCTDRLDHDGDTWAARKRALTAQIRHALTRLLHWTKQTGAQAIGIENLDFTAEKTREKHGRRKRFRQLISGMPTGRIKARLVSMAAELGITIVAVDPAYTSVWGDQHWRKPLATPRRPE